MKEYPDHSDQNPPALFQDLTPVAGTALSPARVTWLGGATAARSSSSPPPSQPIDAQTSPADHATHPSRGEPPPHQRQSPQHRHPAQRRDIPPHFRQPGRPNRKRPILRPPHLQDDPLIKTLRVLLLNSIRQLDKRPRPQHDREHRQQHHNLAP